MAKERKNLIDRDNAWVSYITPFRLIIPDNQKPYEFTLDEINANNYNHGKLCKIVGMLPELGLPNIHMVVCYDGALAIPRIGLYQKLENAVDFYNKIFCQLLLGGLFCEAVDKRDVVSGQLYEKRSIWPVNLGESASSNLHSKLRMRVGGTMDTIMLASPKFLHFSEFEKSVNFGKVVFEKISNLSPTYLIKGVTEIKYRNWALALSSLWITIEQLIEFLWQKNFIQNDKFHPPVLIEGRLKTLKEDHRTWSSSVKQEILFQTNIITPDLFLKLYPIRQARNNLLHSGKNVESNIAFAAYESVMELLLICSNLDELPMENLTLEKVNIKEADTQEIGFEDWIELSNKVNEGYSFK